MKNLNGIAIRLSAALGTARWFRAASGRNLTTILYHRFFFGGEPRQRGIDRLRRQLEWLTGEFEPLALGQVATALQTNNFPDNALLVTVDDALIDTVEVVEEFRNFCVPVTMFVCAGWTARASEMSDRDLLARAVAAIQWHVGPDTELVMPEGRLPLSNLGRATAIDAILQSTSLDHGCLEAICRQLEGLPGPSDRRTFCSWNELREMETSGVSFGAHSVSHVRLAEMSAMRIEFEVGESQRLVEAHLGHCLDFAYPYGIAGTYNDKTAQQLRASGYRSGFLTHPGFAASTDSPYHLPRFALPDDAMPLAEFQARVRGGGIAVRRLKESLLRHRWRSTRADSLPTHA